MISAKQITEVFENATRDFRESPAYRDLVSGKATAKSVREFIGDIFRTHYLSSHIVALCFASLPSAAAALLKENLLEEMGRSEEEKPHSALLIKLAQGAGFSEKRSTASSSMRADSSRCFVRLECQCDFARALPLGTARNHEL